MNRPLLLAAALCCALTAPAFAQGEARSISVPRADLDLQSDAGAEAMLGRIERAAERACGAAAGRADLATRAQRRACVEETAANAIADLNAPLVTAHYEESVLGGGLAQGDAQP